MIFAYDLCGAEPIIRDYPVYGAGADVIDGAVVMRGATGETDLGLCVVGAGALTDVVGVLEQLHDYSVVGDSLQAGTAYVYEKVCINPFGVWRAQYDSADTMAVASTSTTTVTVTSLEDNIDGGWLLGNDGLLQWIVTSASGSCTTKTASAWTSANTLLKIPPLFHQLIKINTAGDQIGTDAAAGSGRAVILESRIQARGVPLQRLDPTKHSGVTFTSPKIFSDIRFLNHAFGPID